jgi:hypothetical protein
MRHVAPTQFALPVVRSIDTCTQNKDKDKYDCVYMYWCHLLLPIRKHTYKSTAYEYSGSTPVLVGSTEATAAGTTASL